MIASAFGAQGQTGCMIETACNFDPLAIESDGSCIWTVDCNGTCGGSFIVDDCNNCFDPMGGDEETIFDFTGSIETWMVPDGITEITIEARGAQGGNSCSRTGGLGARMIGTFDVTPGDELKVLVGEKAPDINNAAGGGGGSFVATIDNTPLLIAGGGSGATCGSDGNPGVTSENGADGDSCNGTGGSNGNGGDDANACGNGAGGGGGFFTDGQDDSSYGQGYGRAFVNGGAGGPSVSGGARGGFGGGTGTHSSNTGGGAGGGYSGGGAPQHGNGYSGGGGGSYNGGLEVLAEEGVNSGNGQVIISYSTIPFCNPGCNDPEADNYDPEANFDDGSCAYDLGCIDDLACNFDPIATIDDGTCIYEIDCAGTCGGVFFEDACGNCYDPNIEGEETFNFTGNIDQWMVPEGVSEVHIEVFGAQGGGGGNNSLAGGLGARMSGTFSVTPGDVFDILVGQQGGTGGDTNDPHGNENGGGGGSFVVLAADDTPYIIAGGGGGGPSTQYGTSCARDLEAAHGRITEEGASAVCSGTGAGGAGGNGGNRTGSYSGGAGGGFFTNGANGQAQCNTPQGGQSYLNGGAGGAGNTSCYGSTHYGGFGGGGAGELGSPGGGGGYSGGGASGSWSSFSTYGGGGGSYNIGTDQDNESGVREGDGLVIISYSTIPECDPGCTNPIACNYDEGAELEDGSCILPDGCTDPIACNYDDTALCDDGSCILPDGCTDDTACNYDVNAVCDDASCLYTIDCAGTCGGTFVEDDCGNCYDPNQQGDPVVFSYTGSLDSWIVPDGVTSITIEAIGAQGGNSSYADGGLGALIRGTVDVTPGEELQILVGEQGQGASDAAGGGGGSFVTRADNTPLVIAGGGGGAGGYSNSPEPANQAGGDASTSENGNVSQPQSGQWFIADGLGGTAGEGGTGGQSHRPGGGGGGLLTDGGEYTAGHGGGSYGRGGDAFVNGGNFGVDEDNGNGTRGGFGGGGGGALGGGGGGGYSGGGGGTWSSPNGGHGGGGGGSFNAGTDAYAEAGANEGNGQVIITYTTIPQCDPGCTNPIACNYDDGAELEDGSCILPDGCTDPIACNYDDTALCDDGSCILPDGCTDGAACNYDPNAICDDGSCQFVIDCAGVCGGTFFLDDCGNCYDPESAENITFEYTGNLQQWTVPEDITEIQIEVFGAQGGGGGNNSLEGGLGARMSGTFSVTPGEVFDILVGQMGGTGADSSDPHGNENGGGGGSFVVRDADNTPYIVAGGGGGGPSTAYGMNCARDIAAAHGQTTEEGASAVCTGTGQGGTNGNGGSTNGGSNIGGAGAGFNGNGQNGNSHCSTFPGGRSYLNGANNVVGGSCYGSNNYGGYGGGGAGGLGSPGGGGGYSGGGAAGSWDSFSTYGGGGGSYNIGIDQDNESGVREGNGLVVISYSTIPECDPGCTNPLACNYDDGAELDDGSCILPDGCTDPTACNYDDTALCDDGSCILPDGCTDGAACNYDPNAICDDGSCQFVIDCAGVCGGVFIEDDCGNCFDPNSTESITFNYTGSIEQWTVPNDVTEVQIEVHGAQGGGGGNNSLAGGLGARMSGTFSVTPGDVFDILVGQQGGTGADTSDPQGNENGGGGGSFVVLAADDTPYIIAGGGGGGPSTQYGTSCARDLEAAHGRITEDGASAVCSGTGARWFRW